MSATLDCGAVGALLGEAPVIVCEGRMFPVEVRYLDQPLTGRTDLGSRKRSAEHRYTIKAVCSSFCRVWRRFAGWSAHCSMHAWVRPSRSRPCTVTCRRRRKMPPSPRRRPGQESSAGHVHCRNELTIDGDRVVIDAGLLRVPD